ncbi:uncharacterized protein SCHCODRAFT_02116286 [Schizophyllum commune H4-8]|uniref:uncharacterized protein n=1 Tax=Schizophyllum commune (strain H4-8 / FGSC 9210) TaxID=578458 RepID=UPI00215E14D5|nr:uncharacterized protein SCHCODRAFT_02116286 [Schizophyllum commune H4-8]KAI5886214.1 hypothetical protein SCHCODRAFT_02116286 [Schizophyllum commune H4-8]
MRDNHTGRGKIRSAHEHQACASDDDRPAQRKLLPFSAAIEARRLSCPPMYSQISSMSADLMAVGRQIHTFVLLCGTILVLEDEAMRLNCPAQRRKGDEPECGRLSCNHCKVHSHCGWSTMTYDWQAGK